MLSLISPIEAGVGWLSGVVAFVIFCIAVLFFFFLTSLFLFFYLIDNCAFFSGIMLIVSVFCNEIF